MNQNELNEIITIVRVRASHYLDRLPAEIMNSEAHAAVHHALNDAAALFAPRIAREEDRRAERFGVLVEAGLYAALLIALIAGVVSCVLWS